VERVLYGGAPARIGAERARDVRGYVYIVFRRFESIRTAALRAACFEAQWSPIRSPNHPGENGGKTQVITRAR
jgi:hypothetical protein